MDYSSHHHKDIFDVSQLDLQKVSKAFGLAVPPNVTLNVRISGKYSRKAPGEKQFFKKSFNSNLISKDQNSTDSRQFAR